MFYKFWIKFGLFIADSYDETLHRNWNLRLQKLNTTLFTWSKRFLPTNEKRVEVIRTFALSRTYYVASILPIRKSMVGKFERHMGKFIWRGALLRVPLEELKNDKLKWGLKLPCFSNMGKSLLTSQCIRLLGSQDSRHLKPIDFLAWNTS